MNLHSTMVSINLFPSLSLFLSTPIYIPLWYLLIKQSEGEHGTRNKIYIPLWYLLIEVPTALLEENIYLHSTMVSINRKSNQIQCNISLIYIPLWYLLIRVRGCSSNTDCLIYIPLWYLLILFLQ